MVRTVLAFFGYVKVPRVAVELSISNEDFISKVIDCLRDVDKIKYFKAHYEAQKAITGFLRSGRLLNPK